MVAQTDEDSIPSNAEFLDTDLVGFEFPFCKDHSLQRGKWIIKDGSKEAGEAAGKLLQLCEEDDLLGRASQLRSRQPPAPVCLPCRAPPSDPAELHTSTKRNFRTL